MARTRDQFSGHVWLSRLGSDRTAGRCPIWDTDTIANNMDWLNAQGYLCLVQKIGSGYTLQVFPTERVSGGTNARFAVYYSAADPKLCFQAAVNDYMHALARDTSVACVTQRTVRWVEVMKGRE